MTTVSAEEVKERLNQGEPLYMIDVREPAEYEQKNNGAHLIPLGDIQALNLEKLTAPKDSEIIVVCQRGRRSILACLFLEQLGYTNTKSMDGGMSAW